MSYSGTQKKPLFTIGRFESHSHSRAPQIRYSCPEFDNTTEPFLLTVAFRCSLDPSVPVPTPVLPFSSRLTTLTTDLLPQRVKSRTRPIILFAYFFLPRVKEILFHKWSTPREHGRVNWKLGSWFVYDALADRSSYTSREPKNVLNVID